MNKAVLRNEFLEKRGRLSPNELEAASFKIAEMFGRLSFEEVYCIHTFYPIPGKFEVDTLKITNWLRQSRPEINLVLSKMDAGTHTLKHYLWQEDTPLTMNSWGITEPECGTEVQPADLDMVLVPLLVFDKKGNRIGYGKGFYDRFLAQCRPDARKVGLSFFGPVEAIDDLDQHDIPLDYCITPDKIWQFK